jgi:DNA-binding LacI/PurR family transcriptional regulator
MIYPFASDLIGELVSRFPCVSLVDQYGPVSIDCVDVNHHQGIRILMKRLLQCRKRIGFFNRKYTVEAAWANRRFSAYVENLIRSGFHYNEQDVITLDINAPELVDATYDRAVERVKDGVDAWMCAADHQAYDLIKALELRGVKVPDDVSVTGFDGIIRPEGAPKLETVKIPFYEIGFSGSRRLLDKINKRFDITQEILLECRLQEGETAIPKKPKRKRSASKSG